MTPQQANERDLLDSDGENRALRTFLMQYGLPGLTVATMGQHMSRSGWTSEYWPDFARKAENAGCHLTKAGAQIWIRHLIGMESRAAATVESIDTDEFWSHVIAYCQGVGKEGQALVEYINAWGTRLRRAPAPTEPAVDRARDLEMRAEGRAEALSLILGQDPEDPFSEYTVGSGPCPATGEYDTQWDEKKLRELFKTGDKFFNLEAKTEMAFWEYQEAKMLIQYEAEQRRATPASPAVPAVPAAPTTILPTNESEK